jgi:hypothetical protein
MIIAYLYIPLEILISANYEILFINAIMIKSVTSKDEIKYTHSLNPNIVKSSKLIEPLI